MYAVIKRGLDMGISVSLIMILSPVMLLAALLIRLTGPGEQVLFKQKRPGKNEKIFTIYKFRTMKTLKPGEEEEPLNDMERMTRLGKFLRQTSIDELPQLFNVLKGDMSLIGPRPLLVEYLKYYNKDQRKRHLVRPGISGWAQVNGRNAIDWEKKFELDVWYVEHMSFWLDLRICLKTIWNVLKRKEINRSQQLTMSHFKGERREG